ncbi:MAG TPA: PAS domain-containing sensor histidine kinase [Thermomicrobiaceae bacterium]|nr:PAS domain-containing sensor histidine kinase [Thermomicrobiaceae bacterium]
MSRSAAAAPSPALSRGTHEGGARLWLTRFRAHLSDRRFWAVQALVVLATGIHLTYDGYEAVHGRTAPDLFIVLMYAVFFVPVIYASLNFGMEGAVPTAVWAAILATPSIILWHHGLDRVAEALQHVTIITLAVVIANRVDREVAARHEAERQEQARRRSEAMYRGIFESAGEAIVVVDTDGMITEANAAAGELFDRRPAGMRGTPLARLVGAAAADRLLTVAGRNEVVGDDLQLTLEGGGQRWIEPMFGAVPDAGHSSVVQILFRDVTEQRQRQSGLEAYTRQIVQAQEDERKRIARELHDSSLQAIVLLCRRLDLLEVSGRELPAATRDGLTEVRQAAEEIAAELRRFSRDLRPSVLDDLGLVAAARWLVSDLERRAGVHGSLVVYGDERRLPPDVELGLFRITQEALRNVERHAAASNVSVTLAYEPEEVSLTIEDDGRGLPVDPLPTSAMAGKLGVLGMRERARLLGGNVRVSSTPGAGTRVQALLPCPASPATVAN